MAEEMVKDIFAFDCSLQQVKEVCSFKGWTSTSIIETVFRFACLNT